MLQAPDGGFYGLASSRLDGANWTNGTVFRFTTNGTLKTLVNFDGTNGLHPFAKLTLGKDENIYGTMVDETKMQAADGSVASIFRLAQLPNINSITKSNDTVTLTWTSFTNGIYTIEYKPTLTAIAWTVAGSNVTATNISSSLTLTLPSASERYFRVVLQP